MNAAEAEDPGGPRADLGALLARNARIVAAYARLCRAEGRHAEAARMERLAAVIAAEAPPPPPPPASRRLRLVPPLD